MQNNLIFDLGTHIGEDTANYISKGYDVVSIEANPFLCDMNKERFNGVKELTLLNKAIVGNKESGNNVSFFINPRKSDWSSCKKEIAEQDGESSVLVSVETLSITDLCLTYGVPYYIKVDIEGNDLIVAKELFELREKPKFISFELNGADYISIFSNLHLSGYTKFQLRNQGNNEQYSSGDFGDYLPVDNWITIEEALSRYIKFRELRVVDNKNLSFGWIDLHAQLGE